MIVEGVEQGVVEDQPGGLDLGEEDLLVAGLRLVLGRLGRVALIGSSDFSCRWKCVF